MRGGRSPGVLNKRSFLAIKRMEELGIEPIQMLLEVYTEAMSAYRSMRGLGEKGDAGPAYLSAAGNAAAKLAGYRYPTLTALAIKDMTELDSQEKVLNTKEAIEILKKDPFAPKEVKELKTDFNPDFDPLPLGKANEVKD